MDHSTRRNVTRRTAGLPRLRRAVAKKRAKHVSHILALELCETCGKIVICRRTQAAADGDDEAVHIWLCWKDVLFGQLDLRNWHTAAGQIPAALVVDCRGVCDALARSSSSCLGLNDKKSGLDALALKQKSCCVWHDDTLVSFCCTTG